MKLPKNTYVLLALLVLPIIGISQQLPQFSQYMYNMITVNPAYAGSREIMVVSLFNRNQWIGVDGAPVTQTLSAHTSIPGTHLGTGISIVNDKLGFEKTTSAYADVSYRIKLDQYDEYQITFGLKGGFKKYSIDDELLNDPDYNTDPFLNKVDTRWVPNFGMGIYFRGESFYLGLSTPKLITKKNTNEFYELDRVSYFFNGGYMLEVNENLKFKPAFLIKYTEGAPLSFDISSLFMLNENIWLGASYRFSDSIGAIANFKINKGLYIGYSYEYITSKLTAFTFGSHELMLSYEFVFPPPRCKCKDLYN
jgi:type IX secretion system PorP/SprF family membrane protein